MKTFLRSLLVTLAAMAAIVAISISACGDDGAAPGTPTGTRASH